MKQAQSKRRACKRAKASTNRERQQHASDAAHIEAIQLQRLSQATQDLGSPADSNEFHPTPEQQDAIDGISAWVNSSTDSIFCTFTGPAGSGKSTVTRLIRRALIAAGRSVGLAAPTHKACGVLAQACGVSKRETATFASLLALREKKTRDQITFVRDYRRKPRIDEAEIWICDEASMLEPELLEMLEQEADFWTRFIFVGDRAQLPPVDHGKVSPALKCSPAFHLSKVRHTDSRHAVVVPKHNWRPGV